jgi:hypothetical protein
VVYSVQDMQPLTQLSLAVARGEPNPRFFVPVMIVNWLRVSMGVGGGCFSGIEMMREGSQICCIS